MTWAGRFFAVALVVGMSGASGCAFLPSDPEECFFDDECSGDDVCIDFVCRGRVTVSPCGVDVVPAGWRCENGTLLCNAPLADQRCDVSGVLADGEVCDDDAVVCRTNCGGDEVSPHCVEDEPGVGRRFGCPDGSVDDSTCACTSKCDCAPGEVCGPAGCAPAPAFCSSGADCPRGPVTPTDQCEAFQCNGFTDQCFDPDPASRLCTDDSQCAGRPGCIAGATCTCTPSGDCVPDVACTSDGVCELSQFCDLAAGQCRDGCRNNASCEVGFVCSGERTCVTPSATGNFGDPCTVAEDCAAPLLCALISGTCSEACAVAEDCVTCSGINGSCTCSALGFCAP